MCQMVHTGDDLFCVAHILCVNLGTEFVLCCIPDSFTQVGKSWNSHNFCYCILRHIPPHSMLENDGCVQYTLVQHIN